MHFLINELSFIAQASNKYEADDLMTTLLTIMLDLEPIQGNDQFQVHSSFSNCKIANGLSVEQWIREKLKSSNSQERTVANLLIRLIRKGPFIDITLTEAIKEHQCKFNQRDVSMSALAGAAYLKGNIVSLKNAPEFVDEHCQVSFSIDNEIYEDIRIYNLTDISHSKKLRSCYVSSPKHASGGWGTLMDLSDEVAQTVLDNGIGHGRQIYGYYKGKFYEFQSDNFGGFHGYPIDEKKVPPKVLKQIKR